MPPAFAASMLKRRPARKPRTERAVETPVFRVNPKDRESCTHDEKPSGILVDQSSAKPKSTKPIPTFFHRINLLNIFRFLTQYRTPGDSIKCTDHRTKQAKKFFLPNIKYQFILKMFLKANTFKVRIEYQQSNQGATMETAVISRRDFIKSGSVAALGIAMLPQLEARAGKTQAQDSGANVLRQRPAKVNFDKASDVAKIGFEGRFAGFWNYSGKPKELKKTWSLGLVATGTHLGTGSFRGDNLRISTSIPHSIANTNLRATETSKPEKYRLWRSSTRNCKLRNYRLYCVPQPHEQIQGLQQQDLLGSLR